MIIKELLTKFFEYTEEPDAFETETERIMLLDQEKELDNSYKKHYKEQLAKLYAMYNYLKKEPWAYDLTLDEDDLKITFVITKDRNKGYDKWIKTSNLTDSFEMSKDFTGESTIITLRVR